MYVYIMCTMGSIIVFMCIKTTIILQSTLYRWVRNSVLNF